MDATNFLNGNQLDAVNFILVGFVRNLNGLFENIGSKRENPNEWEDQRYLRFTEDNPEHIRLILLRMYEDKIDQEKEKIEDGGDYTDEKRLANLKILTYTRIIDIIGNAVQFKTVDYEA